MQPDDEAASPGLNLPRYLYIGVSVLGFSEAETMRMTPYKLGRLYAQWSEFERERHALAWGGYDVKRGITKPAGASAAGAIGIDEVMGLLG